MLVEPGNQFSLTRAALSTCGRAKTKFLSVVLVGYLPCLHFTTKASGAIVAHTAEPKCRFTDRALAGRMSADTTGRTAMSFGAQDCDRVKAKAPKRLQTRHAGVCIAYPALRARRACAAMLGGANV